ncbi:MAG: pyridoxal phosphate-dependent aminotransferase [Candidatus Latescibacterota bacterium]|nr:MAG: pyridoxal phosphate-dependent aminotransferase [Candidatus Latescibacterota bacterium]
MSLRPQRTLQLPERARSMPASPIRKLVPFAERARARGIHIHHLNIGQPDIETPREMLEAYRGYDEKVLAYGHSAGLREYREALARYYVEQSIQVTADEILVTTGGSEAVLFALLAVCQPGDNILVPEPLYTNYLGFAVMAGVEVRPIPTRGDDGFHLPARAVIEARIDERSRAFLYSSPGNPTGTVFGREELLMLRDVALEHGLFIIADEVYREFVYGGDIHTSLFHLDGLTERGIIVDSVSKRYSACGARVGCLLTRNEQVFDTLLRFGQARLCPPTVDQLAALAALGTPSAWLAETRREYQARRDVLVDALQAIPGLRCTRPSGAFYLMAELPVDDAGRFCQWLLESFDLDGRSVMMAPGDGFYVTADAGRREVRIAYVLRREDLLDAVRVLAAGLEAYPNRT